MYSHSAANCGINDFFTDRNIAGHASPSDRLTPVSFQFQRPHPDPRFFHQSRVVWLAVAARSHVRESPIFSLTNRTLTDSRSSLPQHTWRVCGPKTRRPPLSGQDLPQEPRQKFSKPIALLLTASVGVTPPLKLPEFPIHSNPSRPSVLTIKTIRSTSAHGEELTCGSQRPVRRTYP